jgi:hypothetical protein
MKIMVSWKGTDMSAILRLFTAIFPSTAAYFDRDEAYLAQAVDIYDLERRMREIDRGDRGGLRDPMLGAW